MKSQKILNALNSAYPEAELDDEKKLRRAGKEYYKRKVLRSTVGDPANLSLPLRRAKDGFEGIPDPPPKADEAEE